MAALTDLKCVRLAPERVPALLGDLADQFEMVQTMADGQREFLHEVIVFYQTLISTHTILATETTAETAVQQNDAMRKITAWVAIVAVPTAIPGFFGQNVPYPRLPGHPGLHRLHGPHRHPRPHLVHHLQTQRWL